ncbi:Uncharacterised protein [[Clostridium] sordellii]|uniref:Uncharacterized protein n=1 Tax=Paraclostridium sordellii TaxID=1505 RepID=A0A0C7QKP5_PARSO|nr:hypothetical protein [Paeniclostridium sordellii]CEQ04106.1 Uncharacterised protein [[Clostridium] sordellii] [Paeniclostridium sordellii]
MQINKEVKRASCKLVVTLKNLTDTSFINTHNRVVEKFVTDNYNVIIAKHELQLNKKYKHFNTFEKEEVYQEGKEYGDYLVNKFYVEI